MSAVLARPFAPIPSSQLDEFGSLGVLVIRPVRVEFMSLHGVRASFNTDRSNVLFARLNEAAEQREYVIALSQDGLDADADSLAALNSYLRTVRVGLMGLPWRKLRRSGAHRYAWADFCEHLNLNFQ